MKFITINVNYERNVDFINDINERGLTLIALGYRNGMFSYEIASEEQSLLAEVKNEYEKSEYYEIGFTNLDYEYQYSE